MSAPYAAPKPPRSARGRPTDSPEVRISKTLSYILRHGAQKEGIALRADGYARMEDLLKRPKLKGVTFDEIEKLVRENDKKRYQLLEEVEGESKVWWIRAVQGHTLEVAELELEQITSPEQVPIAVHGTTRKAWESIAKTGLSKMNRNHIHLAPGLPDGEGVISGMRKSSSIFIYIDVPKVLADGIPLHRSSNGVILTPGDTGGVLRPEYFARVVDREGRDLLAARGG